MKKFYRKTKLTLFCMMYAAVILTLSFVVLSVMFVLALLATPVASFNHVFNFYQDNK